MRSSPRFCLPDAPPHGHPPVGVRIAGTEEAPVRPRVFANRQKSIESAVFSGFDYRAQENRNRVMSTKAKLRPPCALLFSLIVAAFLLACASTWKQDRANTIDPIHEMLHHGYPEALETRDRSQLLSLFATTHTDEATSPSLEVLERFSRIENAMLVIERVKVGEVPVRAEVWIQVEGADPEGRLQTVTQQKQLVLVQENGSWKIQADDSGPLETIPVPEARFADETQHRGLWFKHEPRSVIDRHGRQQMYIYGSGIAVVDLNADGWEDLVLLSGDRVEVFENHEGFFEHASEDWGVGHSMKGVLTVVVPFDLDNDGDKDLLVGRELAQPVLFRNDAGKLVRVKESGIRSTGRTISASAADFDGDGWVDIFLANHNDVFWDAPDPPGSAENAEADQLFLNNGDGTFRDATRHARVANRGWSLAPAAADYDLDGDVDIFVGNDFGDDRLYRNDGNGRFEEVSSDIGIDKPVASMSADWGDFDSDGDFDLFVGGMNSGSAWVLEAPTFRIERVPYLLDLAFRPYVRAAVREWFRGNRFYENLGDGTFREISSGTGTENSGWAWGTVWLDFDNDGRLDLYGANGMVSGPDEDDL